MKNRILISFLVHALFGAMFVFPVYTAQPFSKNSSSIESISFYGEGGEENVKSTKKRFSSSGFDQNFTYNNSPFVLYITDIICGTDPRSEFSFKRSQRIVDISFLESIRSIVMLC